MENTAEERGGLVADMMRLLSPKADGGVRGENADGWTCILRHGIAGRDLQKMRRNGAQINKTECSYQTGVYAGGWKLLLQAVVTQVAFIDFFCLWNELRRMKWTGGDAAPAARAACAVMDHDAVA